MNKEEIVYHLRGRLRRVEVELRGQKPQTLATDEICRELDEITGIAKAHGISQIDDESEVEVWLRWARIKEMYESGERPELFSGKTPKD